MKKETRKFFLLIIFLVLLLLIGVVNVSAFISSSAFVMPESASKVSFDVAKSFGGDGERFLIPLEINQQIISFGINAEITLDSQDSFVTILLVDSGGKKHLVYSAAYPEKGFVVLEDACEETCLFDSPVSVSEVEVFVFDASANINNINYVVQGAPIQPGLTADSFKREQITTKIQKFNSVPGITWIAGETSVSNRSYDELMNLLGVPEGETTNTCGIEYYSGGFFSFCEDFERGSREIILSPPEDEISWGRTFLDFFLGFNFGGNEVMSSPFDPANPFVFDWRNRHGGNWMTPIKDQGGCGSCVAFGAIGALESVINLYFNQHLDLNLSEQDILSCEGSGGCITGPNIASILPYFNETGVVDETCFPYQAIDSDGCNSTGCGLPPVLCSARCSNWDQKLWKTSVPEFIPSNQYLVKKAVIERGPVAIGITGWAHLMPLVGFGEIVPGIYYDEQELNAFTEIFPDSELVGKNYWILKNSWGSGWGENGYGKFIIRLDKFSQGFSPGVPIFPSIERGNINVSCVDSDNDGFCWWGIGPDKPTTCPSTCSLNNLLDCNDANSTLGECPEGYACGSYSLMNGSDKTPFGDYRYYGTASCCGDDIGEYSIQNSVCCNNQYKTIVNESVYVFNREFGKVLNGSIETNIEPWGIYVADDKVYIASPCASGCGSYKGINLYALNGSFIENWYIMQNPYDVFAYNNNVYALTPYQVLMFDLSGNLLSSWGSFTNARAIDIYNNEVFVLDKGNNSVQVFSLTGIYQRQWGNLGFNNGQFNFPEDISILNGEIFVSDTGNNRVQVFNLQGNFLRSWGVNSSLGIFAENNQVFVTHSPNKGYVSIFDLNGSFINSVGNYGNSPKRVVKKNNQIYITHDPGAAIYRKTLVFDYALNLPVCVFDPEIKIFADSIYPPTQEIQERFTPQISNTPIYFKGEATDYGLEEGICPGCSFNWVKDGQLVGTISQYATFFTGNITNLGQKSVLEFRAEDNNGNFNLKSVDIIKGFVGKWGSKGLTMDKLNLPKNMFIYNNEVYIIDFNNNATGYYFWVKVFSENGSFIRSWERIYPIQSSPAGIYVYNNEVYVADGYRKKIEITNLQGNFIREISLSSMYRPEDIAINDNLIFITDANYSVFVFNTAGSYVRKWGSYGWNNDNQFMSPEGIFVKNQSVYVADYWSTHSGNGGNTKKIKVFDYMGNLIKAWGENLSNPWAVYVDDEFVYVTHFDGWAPLNHSISIFDLNGSFINNIGETGTGALQFDAPYDLSINNNKLFVLDYNNYRVQVLGYLNVSGQPLNLPPVINPIQDFAVNVGEEVFVEANAFDPNGDFLVYSINDTKFVQNQNNFSWQTASGDSGNYSFNLTVSDGLLETSVIFYVEIIDRFCVPFGDLDISVNQWLSGEVEIRGILSIIRGWLDNPC